jgi:phage/plasmid primase-like uncharacterized protein
MRKHYDNRIELTGHIRQLLLAEICRHEDVIQTCNMEEWLNLGLEKAQGASYLGTCPWCGQNESFSMNSKTGTGRCSHCGEAGDYLDLMCLFRKEDLAGTLEFVSAIIKNNDRSAAARRRQKRASGTGRQYRQLQGGAA